MERVSSSTESCIGQFCFTKPEFNELNNFDAAKSWCTAHNSTLAVVNDNVTQATLTQFLNSSNLSGMLFINIKLYQNNNTWFLVDGSTFRGKFISL